MTKHFSSFDDFENINIKKRFLKLFLGPGAPYILLLVTAQPHIYFNFIWIIVPHSTSVSLCEAS